MHPRCRQVPPTLSFSTTATDMPAPAAYRAAAYPPGPPPTTTRSNSSATNPSLPATSSPPASRPPTAAGQRPDHMQYHMPMARREVLVQLDDQLVADLDRL